MRVTGFIWTEDIVEKIFVKHGLSPDEVEEVFWNNPKFKRGPKRQRHGERSYYCLGRSDAGRYIFVFLVLKRNGKALIVSARDMTDSERRYYRRG